MIYFVNLYTCVLSCRKGVSLLSACKYFNMLLSSEYFPLCQTCLFYVKYHHSAEIEGDWENMNSENLVEIR